MSAVLVELSPMKQRIASDALYQAIKELRRRHFSEEEIEHCLRSGYVAIAVERTGMEPDDEATPDVLSAVHSVVCAAVDAALYGDRDPKETT